MKYALLALTAAGFCYVIYLGWFVNAASPQVIGVYVAASLGAWALSFVAKNWAGAIKWVWVAVSMATAVAIFIGPLDYLRLS